MESSSQPPAAPTDQQRKRLNPNYRSECPECKNPVSYKPYAELEGYTLEFCSPQDSAQIDEGSLKKILLPTEGFSVYLTCDNGHVRRYWLSGTAENLMSDVPINVQSANAR